MVIRPSTGATWISVDAGVSGHNRSVVCLSSRARSDPRRLPRRALRKLLTGLTLGDTERQWVIQW